MTYPDALFLIALLAFWAFVLWRVTSIEPTHKRPWHEIWPWPREYIDPETRAALERSRKDIEEGRVYPESEAAEKLDQ